MNESKQSSHINNGARFMFFLCFYLALIYIFFIFYIYPLTFHPEICTEKYVFSCTSIIINFCIDLLMGSVLLNAIYNQELIIAV